MKIQAKDVKTGMTIKIGNMKMTINTIEVSNQKNGIETRIFSGHTEFSMGRGKKRCFDSTQTVKSQTTVSIA
jgi:translation elongation factor P/translation initiation factor 5A